MLKKKAPRKGLSDYQSEFWINVPTRIVLSGSVGSGDSNSRFFKRDNRGDEAAIAQLKFQEVVRPVGVVRFSEVFVLGDLKQCGPPFQPTHQFPSRREDS